MNAARCSLFSVNSSATLFWEGNWVVTETTGSIEPWFWNSFVLWLFGSTTVTTALSTACQIQRIIHFAVVACNQTSSNSLSLRFQLFLATVTLRQNMLRMLLRQMVQAVGPHEEFLHWKHVIHSAKMKFQSRECLSQKGLPCISVNRPTFSTASIVSSMYTFSVDFLEALA